MDVRPSTPYFGESKTHQHNFTILSQKWHLVQDQDEPSILGVIYIYIHMYHTHIFQTNPQYSQWFQNWDLLNMGIVKYSVQVAFFGMYWDTPKSITSPIESINLNINVYKSKTSKNTNMCMYII